MSFIVGIDGPAGSGKGTVTKRIANKLGLTNIDTGITYRCVALDVLNKILNSSRERELGVPPPIYKVSTNSPR